MPSCGEALSIAAGQRRLGLQESTTVQKAHATVSGAPHGTSSSRAFDRWLRYPAGFSEHALAAAFAALADVGQSGVVVDPFCGVGTVGTKARTMGLGFIGIEAHPWIAKIASLKFSSPGAAESLRDAALQVTSDLEPSDIKKEHELVRRSFAPEVLGLLVSLRERIRESDDMWRDYLELALLSNLRTHAAVKVGWPYQLPSQPRKPRSTDPVKMLLRRVSMMVEDLAGSQADGVSAVVVCGDSRDATSWSVANPVDAVGVISSPPYLNNFDYADATRLELYFSGAVSSWKELCDDVRSGMVTATTQQTSVHCAEEALESLSSWPTVHTQVRRLIHGLERERRRRPRGKEYSRVVAPYFDDLGRVLAHLAANLPKGISLAFVVGDSAPYGIYIDTPNILLALGAETGLVPITAKRLRSRGLRWRTNGSRHQVPLSEQLVTFRVAS
jgi:hypothetical protein